MRRVAEAAGAAHLVAGELQPELCKLSRASPLASSKLGVAGLPRAPGGLGPGSGGLLLGHGGRGGGLGLRISFSGVGSLSSGGGSPGTYNVTPGEKLGCVAGRSGSSIDQLTFSSTGPR